MSGARYERTKRADQRLIGFECQECGWISFPERKRICKGCGHPGAGFEETRLADHGVVQSFVVQEYLPDDIDTPQPVAIVDIPQRDDTGEPARVYGLMTETALENLSVGTVVEPRFRELFTTGDRPIHSIKFAVPRTVHGSEGETDA